MGSSSRRSKQWTILRSVCIVLVVVDLCALTWYCWQIPPQQFDRWQKTLTTVGGWFGSVLGFFGLKKISIEKLLDHWSGLVLTAFLTTAVWFFILPFHGFTLHVHDSLSQAPLQQVRAYLDGAKGAVPSPSDQNGRIYIRGQIASSHEIRLEKTGYKPASLTAGFADVLATRNLSSAYLEKEECKINLTTAPSGALIYLDRSPEPIGPSPKIFPLPAGAHRVRLKLDGYFDLDDSLTIASCEEIPLHRTLVARPRPARQTFPLLISTAPDRAGIYVDGRATPSGYGLTRIKLTAGKHKIAVRMPGYQAEEQEVEIPDQTTLAFKLASAQDRSR